GGIAHDLNNALVPVLIGSEMLQQTASGNAEQQQLLSMITASGQRCTAMVKQILTFAKGNRSQCGAVPVRHLVLEMAKIAKDTFPKNINVDCSVPSDLWTVVGEATELHQILMNLCVNARDAMPDGGTLSLKAVNVSLSREQIPSDCNPTQSQFVFLAVADTGTGIPPEIQQRIFEPFFTTKEADKGTGLGLSTVSNLVKRHNGFIQLESQVGKGTQFNIYLTATSGQKPEPDGLDATLPLGNGEMILLVDDEKTVLELTKTLLENYRYQVLTATNGLEAITCFEANRREISLMITDRDMPFMDGMTAARRVRSMAQNLPIIIASASQPDTLHLVRSDPKSFDFLHKPYNSGHLLKSIAQALGAP
ncbi:MAG: ATP-binding protein, partial [Limisphaerales bacterium]